jgi:transcriptional regulator with XRE-family HTH domain
MTKIRDIVASNIRKYRHARGWSQAKLAERVDTSAHYVGMLETKIKFPSPEMAERIAAALGLDSTDLFRSDIDPGGTVKSLQKAVWADIGATVAGLVSARIGKLEEKTGETAGNENPPSTD